MTEIAIRDEQLSDLIIDMQARLEKAEGSNNKASDLADIQEMHTRANTVADMYRMEFRVLTHEDKKIYKEKLKVHKSALKKIQQDVEWLKGSNQRDELFGGARKASIDGPNLDTPDQVMAHGRKIQKESIDALGRTVGVVAETKQIATETAVKVQSQTEQIENMYQDLYQIDDILVRTRKIMKRMMRRTLSNRYLWYLIFLIVVGIIVIIVLETTGGSDTKKEEDQV